MTLDAREMTGGGGEEIGLVQAIHPEAIRPRGDHGVLLRHPFNQGGAAHLRKKLELAVQGNPTGYGKVVNEPEGKDEIYGATLDQARVLALSPPARGRIFSCALGRTMIREMREKLSGALETSILEPTAENLSALEAVDREWAEDTRASLIWEAYRIAVNGLPLGDLPAYLIARKARLGKALLEEALSIEMPVAER